MNWQLMIINELNPGTLGCKSLKAMTYSKFLVVRMEAKVKALHCWYQGEGCLGSAHEYS